MDYLIHQGLELVDHAGYAGIFLVMILGNMGIPIGTEILLPAIGGLVAAGHLHLYLAFITAIAGELVGWALLWAIGRNGGLAFVHRFGRYIHVQEAELARIHHYYEKFGARTVFLCRFIPVLRGVSGLPAGLSEMSLPVFLGYTLAGSALFCGGLIFLGYRIGQHLDLIMPVIHKIGLAVLLIALIAIGIGIVLQRRNTSVSLAQEESS